MERRTWSISNFSTHIAIYIATCRCHTTSPVEAFSAAALKFSENPSTAVTHPYPRHPMHSPPACKRPLVLSYTKALKVHVDPSCHAQSWEWLKVRGQGGRCYFAVESASVCAIITEKWAARVVKDYLVRCGAFSQVQARSHGHTFFSYQEGAWPSFDPPPYRWQLRPFFFNFSSTIRPRDGNSSARFFCFQDYFFA